MDYKKLTKEDFSNASHQMYTIIAHRLYISEGEYEDHILSCGERAAELGEEVLKNFNEIYTSIEAEKPEYIQECQGSNGKYYKVKPQVLADYIKCTLHLLFVKFENSEKIMIYRYKNGCYIHIIETELKGIIKQQIEYFNRNIVKTKDVNEVFSLIMATNKLVDESEININQELVNIKNGFLDMKTMKLIPHSVMEYSTMQIDCNWSTVPQSTPVFDKFLNEFSNGDKDVQQFILEYMGSCISNIYGFRYKKALFMVGKGNTGKTQLKKLTERILGNRLFSNIDLNTLEARFGTSNLYCKRLAGSSDMPSMSVKELAVFKQITGGDSIMIEFKGQSAFSYTYKGFLWYCMNEMPEFSGDHGDWVYDRMIILPCNNVVHKAKRDPDLCDKMYAEREGIIYKALHAFKKTIDNRYKFDIPVICRNELLKYKVNNNPVELFYNECCTVRPGAIIEDSCTTKKMYDVFKAWCKDHNGGTVISKINFNKELCQIINCEKKHLIKRTKVNSFYIFTLNDQTKDKYKAVYGDDNDKYAP